MVNKNILSDNNVGDAVSGRVLVQECRKLFARNGNEYLAWNGFDISATKIHGTYYAPTGQPTLMFPQGSVLEVQGTIGQAGQDIAVWAKTITRVMDENDVFEMEQLCYPTIDQDYLKSITEYLENVSNSFIDPQLLLLSQHLFAYFKPYLPTIPAGKAIHEAFRGGLAQHTYEVVQMAEQALKLHTNMDREVLLFSALFHDVGKTQEFTAQLGYTANARLVTHSSIAIQLFTDIILKNTLQLDMKVFRQIKHCMVSHHGKYSEIMPATKEAVTLHYIDMLCSKMGHMEELAKSGNVDEQGWGKYSPVLEATPYIPKKDLR